MKQLTVATRPTVNVLTVARKIDQLAAANDMVRAIFEGTLARMNRDLATLKADAATLKANAAAPAPETDADRLSDELPVYH